MYIYNIYDKLPGSLAERADVMMTRMDANNKCTIFMILLYMIKETMEIDKTVTFSKL